MNTKRYYFVSLDGDELVVDSVCVPSALAAGDNGLTLAGRILNPEQLFDTEDQAHAQAHRLADDIGIRVADS